jgi:hypothetical protein
MLRYITKNLNNITTSNYYVFVPLYECLTVAWLRVVLSVRLLFVVLCACVLY